MKEGDVVILPMPQSDGAIKNRPAIALREMPRFRDMLVCGVSTQLQQAVADFDEIISPSHPDFKLSGLNDESLIRLGFLVIAPRRKIIGTIGSIDAKRHRLLLERLSNYLVR